MYNKIMNYLSLTILKKRKEMARMLGDVNEVQIHFSILELVVKNRLLLFCISNDVYHKYKTDFICFNFHTIWMDYFKT
jgi:hypothetical protein